MKKSWMLNVEVKVRPWCDKPGGDQTTYLHDSTNGKITRVNVEDWRAPIHTGCQRWAKHPKSISKMVRVRFVSSNYPCLFTFLSSFLFTESTWNTSVDIFFFLVLVFWMLMLILELIFCFRLLVSWIQKWI